MIDTGQIQQTLGPRDVLNSRGQGYKTFFMLNSAEHESAEHEI